MEANKQAIRLAEEEHLKSCVNIIRGNIDRLSEDVTRMKAETKEMYDNYRSGDAELHNELVIALDLQDKAEHTLYKNLQAEKKAYFGRIDYEEEYHPGLSVRRRPDMSDEEQKNPKFSLYIGKNGIMQSSSEILIVDWRAPVASVYYDSDIGKSHYEAPTGEEIRIDLQLKRTFELEEERLHDFYDTDVITNDEFLTKYLAQNKEVVLGEIIATIQKEQNVIIRDTPWHTVIVQGVAGSGKTTVAMHRISYILYNFKERFKPQEFYVIGSNKMLLNYITSVLPSLDVQGINQMTMEEMLIRFLDRDFPAKWLKAAKVAEDKKKQPEIQHFRGSMDFMLALEYFLAEKERQSVYACLEEAGENDPRLQDGCLVYEDRLLYGKKELKEFFDTFSCFQPESGCDKPGGVSAEEKLDMLNQRLIKKVQNICEMMDEERDVIRREVGRYRRFFGKAKGRWKVSELYVDFLEALCQQREWFTGKGLHLPELSDLIEIRNNLGKKRADVYDLTALLLIRKRMKWCDDLDLVSHVVVDEAQDFGVSVFYGLHQVFPEATFTIMGDVSQNIYYDVGMNDWTDLRERVFREEKNRFYRLVKSYRNTVEISEFAGKLLEKGSFETYAIDPVIRHGRPVETVWSRGIDGMAEQAAGLIQQMWERGHSTMAVVCREPEECQMVSKKLRDLLSARMPDLPVSEVTEEIEDINGVRGVMVLPVSMTKGLEFDGVLLWNPSERHYPAGDANVKLLYVAVTRALHELYLLVEEQEALCELLA